MWNRRTVRLVAKAFLFRENRFLTPNKSPSYMAWSRRFIELGNSYFALLSLNTSEIPWCMLRPASVRPLDFVPRLHTCFVTNRHLLLLVYLSAVNMLFDGACGSNLKGLRDRAA